MFRNNKFLIIFRAMSTLREAFRPFKKIFICTAIVVLLQFFLGHRLAFSYTTNRFFYCYQKFTSSIFDFYSVCLFICTHVPMDRLGPNAIQMAVFMNIQRPKAMKKCDNSAQIWSILDTSLGFVFNWKFYTTYKKFKQNFFQFTYSRSINNDFVSFSLEPLFIINNKP